MVKIILNLKRSTSIRIILSLSISRKLTVIRPTFSLQSRSTSYFHKKYTVSVNIAASIVHNSPRISFDVRLRMHPSTCLFLVVLFSDAESHSRC